MTVNEGDQTGSAMETSRRVRETRLCQGAEGGQGGTFTHGRLRGCRVLGGVLPGGTHQEVLPRQVVGLGRRPLKQVDGFNSCRGKGNTPGEISQEAGSCRACWGIWIVLLEKMSSRMLSYLRDR